MSDTYESIPPVQLMQYEATAMEAAQEASRPVMQELGKLAAEGAHDIINQAVNITVQSGIVHDVKNNLPIDSKSVTNSLYEARENYPMVQQRSNALDVYKALQMKTPQDLSGMDRLPPAPPENV